MERVPPRKPAREPRRGWKRGGRRRGEVHSGASALNAADEVATELFAQGRIALPRIWELAGMALERCGNYDDGTLESRLAADAEARRYVREQAR